MSEIQKLLRAIVGGGGFTTYVGQVESVDGAECTVVRTMDGLRLEHVRLNASGDDTVGLVLLPAKGSDVLITSIDGASWFVNQCSKLDGIILNGGTLGGLVKVQELTDKLNALVEAFNSHVHTVSTAGSATAQSGTTAAVVNKVSQFNKRDYENEKIKQ